MDTATSICQLVKYLLTCPLFLSRQLLLRGREKTLTQFETEIIESSILVSEIETGTEPTTESTTDPRNLIACSSAFDSYNSSLLADNFASNNSLMMESTAEQKVDTNSNLTSTNLDLSEDSIRILAERIGAILLEKKEMKGKAEESNFQNLLSLLTDNDKEYICMPCAQYSHSNKVPEKLKKMSFGNFGSFKKLDGTRLVNKERRNNIKGHFKSPLHIWCSNFVDQIEEDVQEFENKNKIAGRKNILNAIYCLKHSLSSQDFVRLNNKDELLSTPESCCATKNDGSQQLFY